MEVWLGVVWNAKAVLSDLRLWLILSATLVPMRMVFVVIYRALLSCLLVVIMLTQLVKAGGLLILA